MCFSRAHVAPPAVDVRNLASGTMYKSYRVVQDLFHRPQLPGVLQCPGHIENRIFEVQGSYNPSIPIIGPNEFPDIILAGL